MINRRQWIYGVGIMAGTAAQSGSVLAPSAGDPQKTQHRTLDLSEFVPTMLQVHESHVERARFPVVTRFGFQTLSLPDFQSLIFTRTLRHPRTRKVAWHWHRTAN